MGCGFSKSVTSSRSASLASIRSQSGGTPTKARSTKTTPTKTTPTKTTRDSKRSAGARRSPEEEFAVFGDDIRYDEVFNAKPRLVRSGIGRGSSAYHDPIPPGEDLHHADELDICDGNVFDMSNLSGYSLSSLSDISQSEKEVANTVDNLPDPPSLVFSVDDNNAKVETVSLEKNNSISLDCNSVNDNKEDEDSVVNVSKHNMDISRTSSAKRGSVITTQSLAVSFDTTHDDDFSSVVGLTTPLTDFDEGSPYRTPSITPSMYHSEDPTPVALMDNNFGPIIEEYEGGLTPRTPRSTANCESFPTPKSPMSTYLARDVFEHNSQVGWHEWVIYKRKVYDNTLLKNVFKSLLYKDREDRKKRREERVSEWKERKRIEGSCEEDEEDLDELSIHSEELIPEYDLEEDEAWNRNGVRFILDNGLNENVLRDNLQQCCIGVMDRPGSPRYWKDIKEDVQPLLNDLIREDLSGHLSLYETEYMRLLQRWMNKYRDTYPPKEHIGKSDLNCHDFPLPTEIAENLDCLRDWIESWHTFDTDIPEDGAWEVFELIYNEIDDCEAIYLESLRSNVTSAPLDMEVTGEAAWKVIQLNLVADDVMTKRQQRVAKSRDQRTDLFNPERMKRRRQKLLTYFVEKYEMNNDKVEHFLTWANEMENGEKIFLELCH